MEKMIIKFVRVSAKARKSNHFALQRQTAIMPCVMITLRDQLIRRRHQACFYVSKLEPNNFLQFYNGSSWSHSYNLGRILLTRVEFRGIALSSDFKS
ncbi:hypothetical protein CEXT_123871 [Caerostris extrusa]|uniref:Uncharacterized protein n=1 Tax=Caerostris extrusa TaxID=172846 RepID=A0AAV4RB96_CAEEX|nr:hypothetical protein CEXT_123871 [Caerostris extrusa]